MLLDYSTYDSKIQPLIRQRMRYLISQCNHEYAASILRMVQETVSASKKRQCLASTEVSNLMVNLSTDFYLSFMSWMGHQNLVDKAVLTSTTFPEIVLPC